MGPVHIDYDWNAWMDLYEVEQEQAQSAIETVFDNAGRRNGLSPGDIMWDAEPLPVEDDYSNPYAAAGIDLTTPLDVALPMIEQRMVHLDDVAETREDAAIW